MPRYRVPVRLSKAQVEAFYAGAAQQVSARSMEGKRVQFSIHLLRPYVGLEGIDGIFELVTDAQNKLVSIRAL